MEKRVLIGILLVVIGVVGIFILGVPGGIVTMDQAVGIAERYLVSLNSPILAIDEIMEFEQNFYVVYIETTTGIGAFEMLIDKVDGRIYPEYGPNMMWNTRYGHGGMMGHHGDPPTGVMSLDDEEALAIAQAFLDQLYPGTKADDPHPFYGYYTIHVTQAGTIYGMLSVNGYDGEVWYHNWHGAFIQSREMH